ncbi:MAG: DUF1501 domain-containing protein [Sedimentisphaerales bacterium]|nr:DUF1501 domain-containing protein [Sedimentisphaerales bacterium]
MVKQQIKNMMTRRELLKRSLIGAAGLSLIDPLGRKVFSAPLIPKARAVIQIWMWGGPSHLDTFDPKPAAGYDYCGPLKNSIPTNVKGIQIGEMLPKLAQQADKYSIIRSMTHGINAHETASYLVQTGHQPGRLVYPSAGAVVSVFKGYDHGYKGLVPPYIVLTQPQGRFSEAGFLGPSFKPFSSGGDPGKDPFVVEGIIAKGISDERQRQRRELLHKLDTFGRAMPQNPLFEKLDQCEDNAYDLMFGDARKLFDLSTEKDDVRDRYGRNTFGQSCLMARRLVEHGVPYVTINYKGWDTHKQHFQMMQRMLPELDAGFSELLQDLSDRGLLESTIIWWGGEFGRTPKVKWEPPWNGGRGHYGNCFSTVVAGGGFKGGQVVGASNEYGTEVASRPVHPPDLLRSMFQLLGIDPDGALPNPRGLNVKVMPAAEEGGLLREIM